MEITPDSHFLKVWSTNTRIYINITIYYLHKAAFPPSILPCAEVVATYVQQEYVLNWWLRDARDQHLERYQVEDIDLMYAFQLPKIQMNPGWLNDALLKSKMTKVIKGWMDPS